MGWKGGWKDGIPHVHPLQGVQSCTRRALTLNDNFFEQVLPTISWHGARTCLRGSFPPQLKRFECACAREDLSGALTKMCLPRGLGAAAFRKRAPHLPESNVQHCCHVNIRASVCLKHWRCSLGFLRLQCVLLTLLLKLSMCVCVPCLVYSAWSRGCAGLTDTCVGGLLITRLAGCFY